MKRLALSLLIVACMFCWTACRHVDKNHLEIYSGDRTEQVFSTMDSDLQMRFMALVNEYEAFDGVVDADHPDYLVSVGPVNAENGTAEYRVWMVEEKLVFAPPRSRRFRPRGLFPNIRRKSLQRCGNQGLNKSVFYGK